MSVHALFPEATKQADANALFEECWRAWPNKANKVMARQKYLAIIHGGLKTRMLDKDSGQYVEAELIATPEEIIAGARAYISSQLDRRTYRLKDDGKYIPHLATWLNRGRWEDAT